MMKNFTVRCNDNDIIDDDDNLGLLEHEEEDDDDHTNMNDDDVDNLDDVELNHDIDTSPKSNTSTNTTNSTSTTNTTTTTQRRLTNVKVRAIFEYLYSNTTGSTTDEQIQPPPPIPFTIVPVNSNGKALSPPSYEFEYGLYILLRPAKSSKQNKSNTTSQQQQQQQDPLLPKHLQHLIIQHYPPETCKWQLSGPQFPTPTSIQQRYCYPQGNQQYSSCTGSALWTMYNHDGTENKEYRLLHVYYSTKRLHNVYGSNNNTTTTINSSINNSISNSIRSNYNIRNSNQNMMEIQSMKEYNNREQSDDMEVYDITPIENRKSTNAVISGRINKKKSMHRIVSKKVQKVKVTRISNNTNHKNHLRTIRQQQHHHHHHHHHISSLPYMSNVNTIHNNTNTIASNTRQKVKQRPLPLPPPIASPPTQIGFPTSPIQYNYTTTNSNDHNMNDNQNHRMNGYTVSPPSPWPDNNNNTNNNSNSNSNTNGNRHIVDYNNTYHPQTPYQRYYHPYQHAAQQYSQNYYNYIPTNNNDNNPDYENDNNDINYVTVNNKNRHVNRSVNGMSLTNNTHNPQVLPFRRHQHQHHYSDNEIRNPNHHYNNNYHNTPLIVQEHENNNQLQLSSGSGTSTSKNSVDHDHDDDDDHSHHTNNDLHSIMMTPIHDIDDDNDIDDNSTAIAYNTIWEQSNRMTMTDNTEIDKTHTIASNENQNIMNDDPFTRMTSPHHNSYPHQSTSVPKTTLSNELIRNIQCAFDDESTKEQPKSQSGIDTKSNSNNNNEIQFQNSLDIVHEQLRNRINTAPKQEQSELINLLSSWANQLITNIPLLVLSESVPSLSSTTPMSTVEVSTPPILDASSSSTPIQPEATNTTSTVNEHAIVSSSDDTTPSLLLIPDIVAFEQEI